MRRTTTQEQERLVYVRNLSVMNINRDKRLDKVTHDLCLMTNSPIAMVSLVEAERVWLTASVGLGIQQVRRSISFCSDAIRSPVGIEILDASNHSRYCRSPLVTGIASLRFYCGVPIIPHNGYPVGALCVLDTKPRASLNVQQKRYMRSLCRNVATILLEHHLS
ncbi:MAG: GAF domain-containing protein [Cytophagaceae bacterium]|nr:MAG: GAF domain-containing protein [Cytophagaceae bacterium]